ncbi:TetR/AcrR family transcriptional regulator [Actinoallomurus iriomotensis]|uniref:TetR family transcriptional regulator n=1 Tax=Actinoallomurus iriomotensis TaxID=478107 RepID=A0A9W6SA88_9ACTN|nr:TetR/AcrR family transcriptional regulator C-terminal domain-containing protein [Actinoallomurus iriomotensis]GLY90214.1 TetR family transcriptional regulator [Actinoallomurus iriomotensis]
MATSEAGRVWFRDSPARREGPPLTRERIVAEAVALLDEEGIGRLTMRRLAERLGTGSTTLYWHVQTKDDVLDLALDTVFGEARPPEIPSGDWRADVIALVGEWRAAMLRHPWTATLLGRPLMGPNVLERTEFLHAALVRAGLGGPALTAAAYGVANYVIGSTMMQAAWQGQDETAVRRAADEHLRQRRDRYPTLAEHGHVSGNDWDATFAQGLTYLLDGITARLAATRGDR